MNYTTLIAADKSTAGSIRSWANHNLLDVVQIVEEAEALLARGLRVREMRSSATLSPAQGVSSIALPTGFLDPISLRDVTNNLTLDLRDEKLLEAMREWDTTPALLPGTPRNYAIFDEALQFEYQYDAAAALRLVYFKKWTPLANTNTNFLTDRYPDLLRCAINVKIYEFRNNDARQQLELTKLAALIQETSRESDLSYRGMVAHPTTGW